MGISLSFELRFVLLALALFRLAEMMVLDAGPFGIFLKLRAATGMYDYDAQGHAYQGASPLQIQIGELLECPHCVGVWLAMPAVLILVFVPSTLEGVGLIWLTVVWLALAGLQSILENGVGRSST